MFPKTRYTVRESESQGMQEVAGKSKRPTEELLILG